MSKQYPIDTATFFVKLNYFLKKSHNIGLREENIKVLNIA